MKSIIENIEIKVVKLVDICSKLRLENNILEKDNEVLKKQLKKSNDELIALKEKVKLMKISKSIESSKHDLKASRLEINKYIREIDLVCVMGVFPGFSGQAFIEATYERCKAVKELINKHKSSTLIEVDGGVTLDNAKKLIECGADVLVSGSHVFKAENPKEIISKLKDV